MYKMMSRDSERGTLMYGAPEVFARDLFLAKYFEFMAAMGLKITILSKL